jgi:hypothetical protein
MSADSPVAADSLSSVLAELDQLAKAFSEDPRFGTHTVFTETLRVKWPVLRAALVEGQREQDVKAGLVRRCNALFSALTSFVDALGWDKDLAGGPSDSDIIGVLYGPGRKHLTRGMFRRAQFALSEAAYVARGSSPEAFSCSHCRDQGCLICLPPSQLQVEG